MLTSVHIFLTSLQHSDSILCKLADTLAAVVEKDAHDVCRRDVPKAMPRLVVYPPDHRVRYIVLDFWHCITLYSFKEVFVLRRRSMTHHRVESRGNDWRCYRLPPFLVQFFLSYITDERGLHQLLYVRASLRICD